MGDRAGFSAAGAGYPRSWPDRRFPGDGRIGYGSAPEAVPAHGAEAYLRVRPDILDLLDRRLSRIMAGNDYGFAAVCVSLKGTVCLPRRSANEQSRLIEAVRPTAKPSPANGWLARL